MDTLGVLYAAITGLAVVGVTLLGDRLGGRIGGLLATAPITTSVAHVVIATSVEPHLAATRVLSGVAALLASTFGIVAFFYSVKYTRGKPSPLRLATGLGVYITVFLGLTLLFARHPMHPLPAYTILFATHALLAFTFMREPIPVLKDYIPNRHTRTPKELAARFTAGFLVVLIIRWLVDLSPPLAGALAVVPAVFLVSLTVLGVSQNAPFAARAAQSGLFGTTAVALFVLTVTLGLQLGLNIWATLPFAWAAYATTLTLLGHLHRHIAR